MNACKAFTGVGQNAYEHLWVLTLEPRYSPGYIRKRLIYYLSDPFSEPEASLFPGAGMGSRMFKRRWSEFGQNL